MVINVRKEAIDTHHKRYENHFQTDNLLGHDKRNDKLL